MSEYSIRKTTLGSGVTDIRFVDSTGSSPTFSAVTVNTSLSANTVSATTFYGDGSNLTGVSAANDYTTTAYTVNNTVVFDRTDSTSAFTVDMTGLDNLPTDEEFRLFGNQSSTGIIYTDGLSVNGGDNTKFDLGLTQGWIVDNTTTPTNPTTQFINFTGETAISPTFLATFPVTYIGLTGNTLSDIVQSSSPFTYSNRRDILEIGAVTHTDNTIVNVINNLPTMGIDPTAQLYDLIDGIGYFNIKDGDNVYSPYTGLTISKNGGDIFAHGSNYENDPKNPHVKTLSSGNTLTFRYRLQDSTEFSDTTQINPGIYDTGSGTGATPTNKYTVQRIYLFPSGISRLQYGQTLYDSLSDAQAAIPSETFNVEQNMSENGILRGFIVLRGDATDLTDPAYAKFVTANHFGDANDTVYGDAHRTEIANHSSTGVRSGGGLSINTDTTKFDITGGAGVIVDNFTNPDIPSQQDVRWNTTTGITSTYVSDTGETFTYITIDENGTFTQTPGLSGLTPQQKREQILLGGILHIGGQILFAWERQIPITSPMNNFEDLTTSIGPFSISGNRISSIPTTLSLEKSLGDSFYFGGFLTDDNKNPNIKTNNTLSATTLVYATGADVLGPSGTTIDVDNYDPNGLGTVTSISPNSFVAHRIWHQPTENVLVFQYGQYEYSNLADARTNYSLEEFVTPNVLLQEAYLVAVIIVRDGEADLDDPTRSQIIPQGKFAGTGGGGTTSDTLQTAYNNSSSPEIVTDGTRGAVDFRTGSGLDSNNVVTFQQNSGTINGYVTGEGYISGSTIDGNTVMSGGTNLNTLFTQQAFKTISSPSQTDIVADQIHDTITFSGVNIDVITNPSTDTITFSADSTTVDTNNFVTGYTYTPSANTFTITMNNGSAYTATLATVSGLTSTGDIDVQGNLTNSLGTLTLNDDVLITGNLNILGTATTIDSETVLIKDNIITLNSNVTGATEPVLDAGIEVSRGSATTASFLWDETNDYWTAGLSGSTARVILEGDSLSLLVSGHTHPIGEIVGLQAALDSKVNFTDAQTNYVNTTGDTMTGALIINNNLTVTGNSNTTGTISSGGTNLDVIFTQDAFTTFSSTTSGQGSVVADNVNDQINFSGVNVDIITNDATNTITFSADTEVGEVNTGLNVGTGTGIYRNNTGTTLNFKTLKSTGTTVDITTIDGGNTINLEVTHIPDTNDYVTGTTIENNEAVVKRDDDTTVLRISGGTNVSVVSGGTNLARIDVTIPADTNTFVTGYTYDGYNQHTINMNNGSAYTTTISTLSANSINIVTVGEDVVSGDLLYLGTDSRYYKSDNSAESTSSTELRLSLGSILSGSTGIVLVEGVYNTTGLTSGSTYWVGTGGTITDTQPSVNGSIVRYVGTTVNDTILEFNPDGLYVEISNQPTVDTPTQPVYREVTSSGNILSTDWTVDVTTTGNTTQILPTAVGRQGKVFNVKNSDSTSTSTITIDTTSSQLIDGFYTSVAGGTPLTYQYPVNIVFQSTGSGWILL